MIDTLREAKKLEEAELLMKTASARADEYQRSLVQSRDAAPNLRAAWRERIQKLHHLAVRLSQLKED